VAGLLVDYRTHMEPGELVHTVEPWTALAQPLEPEGALLAGAWQAQTGRGNGYRGVGASVVEGGVGARRRVTRLAIEAVGIGRKGERVMVEANVVATEL
jgi:hypothetical protein